jgi:uncharacterized protein (DUF885 family)
VKNIQSIVRETDVVKERAVFSGFAKRLKALDGQPASDCQRHTLGLIAFELDANIQKLDVLERFIALGNAGTVSENGLYGMPLGREWYRYFLKRWLTLETTPEALMKFGEDELANAIARYSALQVKMGYADRDEAFAQYLASPAFHYSEGQTPQADYELRQAVVYQNLNKLFLPVGVEPPRVKQSALGAAMPADAYYDADEKTFYFNKARPYFERRSIDWLLLHESTPGHHFQHNYARIRQVCPGSLPGVFYAAYSEGWGAYVEEFGPELGLYRQDSDALGAVEWDLVRSIRVVLDVGINYLGWSRQQALDYWHEKLPMAPGLAEREVARVRSWPVQAITYKLGADMFRRLRAEAQIRRGADYEIRMFHDEVLRYGPMPLSMLPQLFATPRSSPAEKGSQSSMNWSALLCAVPVPERKYSAR